MSRILPIIMIVLLVVLIAAGNVGVGFKDRRTGRIFQKKKPV